MPGPLQNRSRTREWYDRARWRVREYHAAQQDKPFYARNGFIGAAVFVGTVITAGIVLLIGLSARDGAAPAGDQGAQGGQVLAPGDRGPAGQPSEVAVPFWAPRPGSESTGAEDVPGCPEMDSDSGQGAVATAPQVQWSPVGDAPIATTGEDGPAVLEGPKRCYAPTATGALLAAHNFTADGQDPGVDALTLTQRRVLPTASMYDQLIAEAGDAGSAPAAIVPVAYRFITAEPDRYETAVVYQVSRSSVTALIEQRLTISWVAGDWMIAEGVLARQISEVPPGYLAWGPLTGLIE